MLDKEFLKKLQILAGIKDQTTAQLLMADLLAPGHDHVGQLAREQAEIELVMQSVSPSLFSEISEDGPGDILLGHDPEDPSRTLGLFPLDLTRLALLVGTPKSGKTTLVRQILTQLIDRCGGTIPESHTLSFDSKLDSVALYRLYPDIVVIPWQSLCLNPLQVPAGVDPKVWMNAFVDLFCGVFFIGDVGYQILFEAIDELYTQAGVYQGSLGFPTISHLYQNLEKRAKSNRTFRGKEALGSLLNRLSGLLTVFGDGLDYHCGFCVPELTSGHIVLASNGLSSQHCGFLVSLIVSWTYAHHEANSLRDDLLRIVFIVDEAEPVLGKDARAKLGRLPMLFSLLGRLREFGIGLVVASQCPRSLDDRTVLSFSQIKIIKNLVDADDVAYIGRSIGLDKEQMDFCRGMKPEEAVAFVSGRQNEPSVIHVPDFPLDKSFSWPEVNQIMDPRIKKLFPLKPVVESPLSPAPQPQEAPKPQESPEPQNTKPDPIADVVDLKRLLNDIYNRPFVPKSQRLNELFGGSVSKCQKIARTCLETDYVEEHTVSTGGRSGQVRLWSLTDEGYSYIGLPRRPLPGKGDLTHQYLQHLVSEKISQWGYKPKIEFFRAGKNVDVGLRDGNQLIALEIGTTAGNEATNVLKDIDAGFHFVVVLAINKAVAKAISRSFDKMLSTSYLRRSQILIVSEFLQANSPPWTSK